MDDSSLLEPDPISGQKLAQPRDVDPDSFLCIKILKYIGTVYDLILFQSLQVM